MGDVNSSQSNGQLVGSRWCLVGHMICPSCRGHGTIQSADNFPDCALCYRRGVIAYDALEREVAREMRGTYDMQDDGRAWAADLKRWRREHPDLEPVA